jgi:hypothetical protein
MSRLQKFNEMTVTALKQKCRNRYLSRDGTKPVLVQRLVEHEISEIKEEIGQYSPDSADLLGEMRMEVAKELQLARVAGARQVYNAKFEYLINQLEVIKIELDEEEEQNVTQYNKTEKETRKKARVLAASVQKSSSSKNQVTGGMGAKD